MKFYVSRYSERLRYVSLNERLISTVTSFHQMPRQYRLWASLIWIPDTGLSLKSKLNHFFIISQTKCKSLLSKYRKGNRNGTEAEIKENDFREVKLEFLFHNKFFFVFFNRFDPDRFCPEVSATRPRYSFVPFGFCGGRQCPGYR